MDLTPFNLLTLTVTRFPGQRRYDLATQVAFGFLLFRDQLEKNFGGEAAPTQSHNLHTVQGGDSDRDRAWSFFGKVFWTCEC